MKQRRPNNRGRGHGKMPKTVDICKKGSVIIETVPRDEAQRLIDAGTHEPVKREC